MEQAEEQYLTEKNNESQENHLFNYPIFMAMPQHIGYDASGKETPNKNELPAISAQILNFIITIQNGQDANF